MPLIGDAGDVGEVTSWASPGDLTCDLDDATATSVLRSASELLFVLSGRIFGTRQVTLRPRVCTDHCSCRTQWDYLDSEWRWMGHGCSCDTGDLRLPLVDNVLQVFVDGVELPIADYQLYDHHRLVRTDGERWPCCQHLSVNPEALSVVAQIGTPVPESGKRAAVELACQLAAIGTSACRLPQRVQTISRQGVTWTVLDPQDFLDKGRLGLYEVDAFLAAVNPSGVRRRAAIASPNRRVTSVSS